MITDEHPFEFAPQQDEYTQLLTELHNEYCSEQPLDVLQFCSNFFIRKLEEQRLEHRNNNHSRSNMFDSKVYIMCYIDKIINLGVFPF